MKSLKLIDFHTHILPGADHGSDSVETTKAQLELLQGRGVEKAVATPHFYPQRDSVGSFLERRERSVKKLASLNISGRPEIYLGAEVLVCPGLDHMPELSKLCIKGTDVILLEMPFSSWREEHIEAVARIARTGLVPVMAHIDRYHTRDVERLLNECNVLCQINGETMGSAKGKKRADSICRRLTVAAVGSDIHGADKSAVKRLSVLASRLEKKGINVTETTAALLSGAEKI